MTKSNTEIAAEVFGSEWPEQPDAVRGEWESFVAACRDGGADFKDKRHIAVMRALGIGGDAYAPSGGDAVIVGAPKPKKPSVLARVKGKKHAK